MMYFKSIYTTIISNIQKSLGKSWGWIIYSLIGHKAKPVPIVGLRARSTLF